MPYVLSDEEVDRIADRLAQKLKPEIELAIINGLAAITYAALDTKYLTVAEISKKYHMSDRAIRQLIDEKKLACVRIGRSVRISNIEMERHIREFGGSTNFAGLHDDMFDKK
jgi:excisionase family DNA binding protein